jgi:hypothetical protein
MRRRRNIEPGLVRDLLKQKKRYEKYFATLDPAEVNNQAHTAYMSTIKTLYEIHRKLGADSRAGLSPEELAEGAREILEKDYGVTRG